MLTYTIEFGQDRNSLGSKTLYVEGRLDSRQGERLKGIIIDALYSGDHLILDITKVEEFPPNFMVLITDISHTAKHLGKRFIVRGHDNNEITSIEVSPVTRKSSSVN